MTDKIQQGETATISLIFTLGNPPVVQPAPVAGGIVSVSPISLGTASLAEDQKTVTFHAGSAGVGTVTYTNSTAPGLTAVWDFDVVTTTADAVTFDETSLAAH